MNASSHCCVPRAIIAEVRRRKTEHFDFVPVMLEEEPHNTGYFIASVHFTVVQFSTSHFMVILLGARRFIRPLQPTRF